LRQKFDQYDPVREFASWACGVAHLELLSYRRQQKRWGQVFDEATMEKLAHARITRDDLLDRRREALDGCVAKLASTDRRIVDRYYYQGGKTAADVAAELGRPVNTVLKALIRIRRLLRICVDRTIATEDRA
jgi:RNA polymerase sigma-70 factor (ECF subfamily)